MAQFPLTVDQVDQYHPELTSAAALRATVTLGLQWPVIWVAPISGDPNSAEQWKLRLRGNGENDNGTSFIVPSDWNAGTNNVIWVRIA